VSFHYNKVMDDMHDHWTGASYFVRPIPPGTLHFPEVVEDAYRLTDWWIGRFLDALPPDRVLALVSDHGYEFNGTAHIFAPPGVIVLSGGPFACGRLLRGAGVLDVVPTLLVALGIPPAEAMPGRVLEMAFGDGAPPAPTRVASYPDTWRHPEASPALSHDWEDLRRSLQALGYAN
jgi:arylsulfatase A-like enzyme